MSITTVRINRDRKVWKCADLDDDARRMLQAAHIEREDAGHVRVTCADSFALASVVYPAEVAEDFTVVDIPAELLKRAGCDNCGAEFSLALDTEKRTAEWTDGHLSSSAAFVAPVGTPFPDWRELFRKVLVAHRPGQGTPAIAIDPELLSRATEAIGEKYKARICLPTDPHKSVVILGGDGCFALVMPIFTPDDAPERLARIAKLAEAKVVAA